MEPLSAASSVFAVVSVAIELAKVINKLVIFCNAVQEAPSGLGRLVEDLEVLGELLEQVHAVAFEAKGSERYIERAVDRCRVTVEKLEEVIWKPSVDLRSEKSGRRFRGRVRIALGQTQIDALREEIERAKSQLQVAQLDALIRLSHSHHRSQKQYLLAVSNSTQEGFSKILFEQRQLSDAMQLLIQGDSEVGRDMCIEIKTETRSDLDPKTNFPSQNAVKYETVAIRETHMINCLVTLQRRTKSRRTTRIIQQEARSTNEEHVDYVLYPTNFLRRLGFAYGLVMQTRSTSWQFTLQPFNVIKKTSPIFEFCRNGNVEAVQTLIGLGEASVRDRDPDGRTPLWIAAHSLQPDVAELLLQEGADPHVNDWRGKRPPIAAIQESVSTDVNKKLSLLSLFQTYAPDGHDELAVWYSTGMILHSYRPQRIIPMDLASRKQAAQTLFRQVSHLLPRDDEHWISILILMMQLFYDAELIRWTLNQIQGVIPQTEERSAVHRALAMKLFVKGPVAAEMVVRKTEDLHRPWGSIYWCVPPATPMTLALYQPRLFLAWVGVLRNAGIDIEEFVKEELEGDGSFLRSEGWEVDSLTRACRLQLWDGVVTSKSGFFGCERCGKVEGYAPMKVDLEWRRRLRDVRMKQRSEVAMITVASEEIESTPPKATSTEKVLPKEILGYGIDAMEKLPYTIVCSDGCLDGVCVAWVFEDSSTAVFLPPYNHTPKKTVLRVIDAEASDASTMDCPTKKMPGAFID
ncbi:hypothetical protein ONS95_014349 [Cadophora gregata]|uniref:uncharacterized protein n=1 Tax=Cadophora gregata TaxID=51156 RepID=UPI0026DD17EB|nr:uncharacterized protein ONS95_014349 [Cadophora gregata]KAK0112606.1 hypothetical protein ONS95_014349 [Cadophora gregata]